MKYFNIEEGTFVKRINRFIAEVNIDGEIQLVHVKNTGRCRELLIEGRRVYLQKSDKSERKTKYSLISVYKGEKLVNIDSQVPNFVVYESLANEELPEFKDLEFFKREQTYKSSRFDIYYKRKNGREGFIEIKGVTLEEGGSTMFPDAPTERGKKHIYEMIEAVRNGYEGTIFFLVQLENAKDLKPNKKTDIKFAEAIKEAVLKGVNIVVYTSIVTKNTIKLNKKIKFIL